MKTPFLPEGDTQIDIGGSLVEAMTASAVEKGFDETGFSSGTVSPLFGKEDGIVSGVSDKGRFLAHIASASGQLSIIGPVDPVPLFSPASRYTCPGMYLQNPSKTHRF